ncbi:MAG TPA: Zn-dependent hydrolase [Terriglobales bacterium]|nr:Zn-dependent hydrolase [Terriglobales bacterium]
MPAQTSHPRPKGILHHGTSRFAKPEYVVPDLAERLARYKRVEIPFNKGGLSARELQMIDKLVEAARDLDYIYWRQSDPAGLALYKSLEKSTDARDERLRRFLVINGSRFDLTNDNKPFVGTQPMPPGRGLYPEGLTRADLEKYVAAHPEQKDQLYSPYTVIRRNGDELEAIPYHVEFRQFLIPAAKALREAADLSPDSAFANFLRLRADALLSDDYFKSDLAWVDLQNPKFDVIMAPYETYLDGVLGVKTSYGSAVMIRNEEESAKLAIYQQHVPEIQDSLPLAPEDRPSKSGQPSPMEVVDTPFRGGDLLHGYQAVADNLPNDARIHEQKGTKKIFFKNYMDVRVNYIILPLAKRIMDPQQAAQASAAGYMATTVMHEICHGLGPAYARTPQGKQDIREAMADVYPGLEEAKADVVGMLALKFLIDKGVLPKEREQEYYASYVAGIFRTVRFGVGEAHGQAEMMEFNYLSEQKAITRDATGRYHVDYDKMPGAIAALAKELLEQEATGDRARATAWFQKYDVMPNDLRLTMAELRDVPVDVEPVQPFAEEIQ